MGLFSGVTNALFGTGGQDSTNAAVDAAKNISLPELKEFYPELYKQAIFLNPQLEDTVALGSSAMAGVSTDPRLKQAQMSALAKLQGITDNDGRDAQFQADASRTTNDVNRNLRGNSGAITQDMATRGMSGGMSEMVQRQMAAQGAANLQSQQELDLNAQAQQRALAALMNQGQLGGQIQQQDFNQQAQVAGAQDAISQFNAANSQAVKARNTSTANAAKEYNTTNAQNTQNQNTNLNNQAQQYNLNLSQQDYENKLRKAGLLNSAYGSQAQSENANKQGDMALVGGLINAGASAYGAGSKK